MEKEVKTLPEKIVSRILVSKNLDEFNRKKQNLVDAYNHLPRHLNTDAIPHNPREITAERLTSYVEKMKATLPEDNKQGRMAWDNLVSDALINIKYIREFFTAFPLAEFEVNPTLQPEKRLKCKNAMEAINAASFVEIPAECKEYFEKVQAFADALNDMHDFERIHNLQKQPMEEMVYYAAHADMFAQKWFEEYFSRQSNIVGMGNASIVVGNRKPKVIDTTAK